MRQFSDKEMLREYEKLPPEMRSALTSPQIYDSIEAVAKKHGLLVYQLGELVDLIGLVMLGLVHPNDFVSTFAEEARVSEVEARRIAEDVNNEVFEKVKTMMREAQEEKEGEETEEAQDESEPANIEAAVSNRESVAPQQPSRPRSIYSSVSEKTPHVAAIEQAGGFDIVSETSHPGILAEKNDYARTPQKIWSKPAQPLPFTRKDSWPKIEPLPIEIPSASHEVPQPQKENAGAPANLPTAPENSSASPELPPIDELVKPVEQVPRYPLEAMPMEQAFPEKIGPMQTVEAIQPVEATRFIEPVKPPEQALPAEPAKLPEIPEQTQPNQSVETVEADQENESMNEPRRFSTLPRNIGHTRFAELKKEEPPRETVTAEEAAKSPSAFMSYLDQTETPSAPAEETVDSSNQTEQPLDIRPATPKPVEDTKSAETQMEKPKTRPSPGFDPYKEVIE